MKILPFMALASGEKLMDAVIWLIGIAMCAWLLWWLVDYAKIPEPFNRVARVLIAIVAVVFLIRTILSITGQP